MIRNYYEFIITLEKTFQLLEKCREPTKFFGFEIQDEKFNAVYKIILKMLEIKKYPTQRENFLKDLKTYSLATNLWYEEEYPDISKIFNSLRWKYPIQKFNNIIEIRDKILLLFKSVKSKYPILFQEEIKESMENFFNEQEKPSRLVVEEYPILLDVEDSMISLIDFFNDVMQKILKNVERTYEKVKLNGKIKNTRKFLVELNKKNIINGFDKNLKNFDNKVKQLINPSKIYDKYPESIGRRILSKILSYDSYQVQLIKFYWRLHWILKNGNRNFPIHRIDSVPNYNKLNEFLKEELSSSFSNLSKYFQLSLELLTPFRHIQAHELPKISLTKNKKYAYITQRGAKEDLKIYLKGMGKLINSYIFFSEVHIKFLDLC